MQIHVINLDRTPDRMAEFAAANAHLTDVTRFSAIDGNTVDVPVAVQRGIITADIAKYYKRAALGNALSHFALWESALSSNQPITICEDDAIFHLEFAALSRRVLNALPADWDMIFWGCNTDTPILVEVCTRVTTSLIYFDHPLLAQNAGKFQRSPLTPFPLRLLQSFGLACYSISAKGAAALKGICQPIRMIKMERISVPKNFDQENRSLDTMLWEAYMTLKVFISYPPLVITKNDQARSTVQAKP